MEPRNIIATLECYVHKDGRYLMLHRNVNKRIMPGVWMAPGGKRERNEGLFACARREVMEETGLTIKNLRVMCTGCALLKDLNQELFFTFVHAEWAGGEAACGPEEGELEWLTLEEILRLDNLLGELKHVLPLVLNKESAPIVSYSATYEKGNEIINFELESPE